MSSELRLTGRGCRLAMASLGLGAVSACATFGGSSTPEPVAVSTATAELSGIPNSLEGAARQTLETNEAAPTSVLAARRNAQRGAERLTVLLESEGYLLAEVTPQTITSLDEEIGYEIDAGPVFKISTRSVSGIEAMDDATKARLEQRLRNIAPGAPARSRDIEDLEADLISDARKAGYAFVESDKIDVLASREDHDVALTYQLKPGPRVRLGDLDVNLEGITDPDFIRTTMTWKTGDYFTPEKLQDFRGRLRASGLFDGVSIAVSETADESGLHPVSVALTESKRRSVGVGLTASTTEGVGADAFWERRNLTSRGDQLRAYVEVATLARKAGVRYERPNIGRYGRTLAVEFEARGEETDAYDLEGVKLAAGLAQPFNQNFTISAGVALDATRTTDFLGERDQLTLSVPLAATYSTVKEPLDPKSGNKVFLGVEPGTSFNAGAQGYTRVLLTGSTYKAIANEKLIGAIQARVGNYFGSDLVPADRRFFAGGGGSVRGYEYQSLSPRDPSGVLVGGKALIDMSAELRWRRSERLGYVVFMDSGAAAESIDEAATEMRQSVGVGVRYYPGFGPIRFDIATPLGRREGEDPVQVYISIGQAF